MSTIKPKDTSDTVGMTNFKKKENGKNEAMANDRIKRRFFFS
jgi:hypothetical protein